jgi:hypothetical protein
MRTSTTARERLLAAIYAGSVVSKRETAQAVLRQYGDRLCQDANIGETLARLLKLAGQVSEHMHSMELGQLCTACAARQGGCCCSLYMAGETDGTQLLMNLLAGIDVREQHTNSRDCCYLGPRGCIFPIKPMFCLNYNCHHILSGSPPEKLRRLEQLTGLLLNSQYQLEQLLIRKVLEYWADGD